MTRETISLALNALDERYVSEAAAWRPEAARLERERSAHVGTRRLLALALAAALMLSLGLAAYAANLFGLRELYSNPARGDMPEEAAARIERQNAETAGTGWRARVLESYCDESTVLLTAQMSADDGYLLAPTDADPDTPLRTVGLPGEGTIGDYARQEGKTILFAEVVPDGEALGMRTAGMRFESSSPQEMTIYFEGSRSGGASGKLETTWRVVVAAWSPEAAEGDPGAVTVERAALTVTLTEGSGEAADLYLPADPYAVPGVELGELRLTQTPLGLSLRLKMRLVDPDAAAQLLTLRLDGVEFHGDGYLAPDSESVFVQGQGDFGERPTIRFLDWDKNTVAVVVFEKVG